MWTSKTSFKPNSKLGEYRHKKAEVAGTSAPLLFKFLQEHYQAQPKSFYLIQLIQH
jgi:hypothetical protein